MTFAIKVENLGKRYRLGATHAGSVRELVNRTWKRAFGRQEALLPHEEAQLREIHDRSIDADNSFWALRDVSFAVKPGEVVGIIGRNGSGKSTLLKILSQITAPTTGRVELHGRVASLLEVGTGFHPELSGRENVFLNGAILGMSKPEIRRKFDEIVAFAEIEKFIDTPVKRYSSGMYVRLAFAVAAHLEPEMLIVDEVLAVGDASFQQKCIGKMSAAAKGGRTVLFVSHNMGAVASLCSAGIMLVGGSVLFAGPINRTIDAYNALAQKDTGHSYAAHRSAHEPHFTRIDVFQDGTAGPPFRIDRVINIRFELQTRGLRALVVGVRVRNSQGITVIHSSDEFLPTDQDTNSSVRHCTLPAYALAGGTHFLRAGLLIRGQEPFELLEDVVSFRVEFMGRMADRTSAEHWCAVTGPGLVQWGS